MAVVVLEVGIVVHVCVLLLWLRSDSAYICSVILVEGCGFLKYDVVVWYHYMESVGERYINCVCGTW